MGQKSGRGLALVHITANGTDKLFHDNFSSCFILFWRIFTRAVEDELMALDQGTHIAR